MQCGRRNRKWLLRNVSKTDLWARLLSSCHRRLTEDGLQTERPRAAGKQHLYAALEAPSVGSTHVRQEGSGWLTDGDDHSQNSHCQVLAQEEMLASSWRGRTRERRVRKDGVAREVKSEKAYGMKKKIIIIMWEIEWKIKQGRQDGRAGGGGGGGGGR